MKVLDERFRLFLEDFCPTAFSLAQRDEIKNRENLEFILDLEACWQHGVDTGIRQALHWLKGCLKMDEAEFQRMKSYLLTERRR